MLIKEKTIWTPDNSYLLKYKSTIETGEIVVGQELWQELENLQEDIVSEAYIYDTENAWMRMDFMENCIKLTKSPYYNKPMILMLWQKAFIEASYSFKMTDSLLDRFKRIVLEIARKNTKSETCSALGMSELITGPEGADLVCSSNDDNQASITYDAIDVMRMLIDPMDLDTKRNQRHILNKANNSKIFKLSDKTQNKEGRNIDWAVVDEVQEMKTNVIVKSIEQSQSLKDNPKLFIISTEGFVIDGFFDGELKKCRKIVRGEDDSIAAKRTLPWLYTQDSELEVWQGNRENKYWMKSNPTLGVIKKWDYLEEQVDGAKESKADRIFVLSKDFNIKQSGSEAWLNLEDYSYEAVYDLEDFRGCYCMGAVDLAETTDLICAKVLLMQEENPTKFIYTMYFIPEGKLEHADDKEAGAKYEEWAKEGLVTITEGNDVDLSIVADWFYGLYQEFDIKLWKCGYDQKFSRDWINRMNNYNWTKEDEDLILIMQNAQTLSNAMKLAEMDLRHKLVNYNMNKVDKWCFGNAGILADSTGKCLCVKMEPNKKIDGAVTFIILYEMYRRYRTEFKQMIGG